MSVSPSAGRKLTDRQRINWLRLIRTDNVGPVTFRDLVNRFGSAETALAMLPELAMRGGASRPMRTPSEAAIYQELERAERVGGRFVAIGEPDYPPMLRHMDVPPPLLAVRGRTELFDPPAISIVGARNASAAGVRMARVLASDIGQAGYTVVSGLARGIDAAAHEGSMKTGTVAVLAGGIDRPYPPENIPLCETIGESGLLVSEMPFGWEPRAKDFPRRNRLVAGLGLGLVVVEAATRSGSLISARLAGQMGRLVFAVPGSPLDPRAAGTNGLLKNGATLVTEARDVLETIAPLTGGLVSSTGGPPSPFSLLEEAPDLASIPSPGDNERDRVLEALSPVPVHTDELVRHTGLHQAQLVLVLLELDLAGRLQRHAGGSVSLVVRDL